MTSRPAGQTEVTGNLRDAALDDALERLVDLLSERLAGRVAEKVATRLDGRPAPEPAAPTRMLTPQQVADLIQVPVGFVYKNQKQLGGVHLGRRCLRFPEAALRRRFTRP